VVTHLVFAAFILFLLGWLPWPNVDGVASFGQAAAIAVDLVLILLFGLQHSGMARAAIKRAAVRWLPADLERATYVHCANLALALLVFLWQPIPGMLWDVRVWWGQLPFLALFALGWALASWGSLLIDHLQLLGLKQALSWSRGVPYAMKPFQRHWLYHVVRHPIQLGLILAFWATPHMSVGHLILAVGLTLYILVATQLEERDLVAEFGEEYRVYRTRVPALVPWLRLGTKTGSAER
jgi:protein-S-isoprenylcysteine O-methyltransferase Ste14